MQNLLENITVMIVEDDADMRDLLRAMLEGYGATVIVAESVEAALTLCRRLPPHLVVSDIRLGNSDGFALIKAIRKYNRKYRGFIPAIALTGFSAPGEHERAIASGFNAFLPKPFNPAELIDTITLLLGGELHLAA